MLRDGSGVPAQVTDQRHPERGLPQRLAQLGDDLRRGVGEPVEDPQHPRADVVAGARSAPAAGVRRAGTGGRARRGRGAAPGRWRRSSAPTAAGRAPARGGSSSRSTCGTGRRPPRAAVRWSVGAVRAAGRRPRAAAPPGAGGGSRPARLDRSRSHPRPHRRAQPRIDRPWITLRVRRGVSMYGRRTSAQDPRHAGARMPRKQYDLTVPDLTGQRAVVTGASDGIGLGIATSTRRRRRRGRHARPQPRQGRGGDREDPHRHPAREARRWRPRPVLAGVGRRPRREAPPGRDADPPPHQQRRRDDPARTADHRRRLRAAARDEPPRPLRAHRATCCRCCGPARRG